MDTVFTILLVTAIIVWVILFLKTKITNRKCFLKSKEKLENYGTCKDDNLPEIDIHTILNDYSKEGSNKKITNINKHYTYNKGNFNRDLLNKITSLTHKLLNHINNKYRLRIKLSDIERIFLLII